MRSAASKPRSVYLSAEENEKVKRIADALEISEHAARVYAIRRLIADWERGWRPKRKKKTVQILEP